ncbi:hypothetical protein B4U80_03515 [Leptotrombidium deliense]|uniref:TIL domain-containing protein n=1 Tax=Leptotrombidium deliense TaxID=299467 RepID=A0A443S039_9ACAR|nr:hypothetical protein B4U80_03515 [Leptotrombidium deliense]
MKSVIVLFVVFTVLVFSQKGEDDYPGIKPGYTFDCDPDFEIYVTCGSKCADTCYNYNDNKQNCSTDCVVGCWCKPQTVRSKNGTCVSSIEC